MKLVALSKGDLGTSNSEKDGYRVKGKEKGKGVYAEAMRKETGELGEALWVHVGNRDLLKREEQLSCCLVGCFGDSVEVVPSLSSFKEWAYERWSLKGGLKISSLGGTLVLFEFEDKVEADLVLLRGSRCLRKREFSLQKWGPEVGEVFKSIGESCGGFIAVDEETAFFSELQWARILVRTSGKFRPGTLSAWFKDERQEVKDEGGGDTRASVSVREVQNFQSDLQSRGTGEQFVCGRRQKEAAVAVAAEGRRPSVVDKDFLAVEAGWGGSPRPTFIKAGTGFLEQPSSARAPSAPAEGEGGMDAELLAVEVEGAMELTPSRRRVTDEALMEEASRYYTGHTEAVRASEGVDYGADGELGQFAMSVGRNRAALAFGGWSEPSWDSVDAERGNGLALVPVGSDLTSPFEKRSVCHLEEEGSDEGRMKGKIEQKGMEGVTRKMSLKSSKSSRELKKLEWTSGGAGCWEEGVFSISFRFKNCVDGVVWVFTGVYGPVCNRDSEDLWEELRSVKGLWSDPWCVGGDFNLVRFLEERSRGGGLIASMRRFSEVLEDRELKKLEWTETKIKGMTTGLVRSLGVGRNIEWRAVNSRGVAEGILVFCDNRVVELVGWEEGFSQFLEIERIYGRNLGQLKGYGVTLGVWEGISICKGILPRPVLDHFLVLLEGGGTSSYILDAKLRALKNILKIWNKEEFGIIETKKGEALMQVEYWDEKEKYAALNMEECEARNGARESYKSWVMRKEIFLRQKSRELWLKEGDNSTRFFHRMANAHSRRNWMSKLKVNGCWHLEENNLKNSVVRAFQMLYSEEEGRRPSIDGLSFIGLDNSELRVGESFLGGRGVCSSYRSRQRQSPGAGWFYHGVLAFWVGCVPKKEGAEDLKDFRPISLVGSLYKLLAKVLANRIKKVMGKVISEPQNAFVEGRQILDAVLIANEVVDSRLKSNQGGVMCKLDIEKAYDHVCWKFLLAVLKKMALGRDGLRWRVRGRGGEGILISHLLFADDTVVFCEESQDQLTNLSWLLMWFEACSRLRVNLEKSELIPVGRVNDIEDLALELGCKVGGLPSCYLGLPLGAPFKSKVKSKTEVGEDSEGLPVGGGALEQRPHLVKWNLVCLERKKGFVEASDQSQIWCRGGVWCTRAVSGRHGVGLWKAIRKEWLGMNSSLAYRVDGVGDGWTPLFSRTLNDWEIEMVEWFMLKIQAFRVQREDEDKVVWTTSRSGDFSVKSLYSILEPGGSACTLMIVFGEHMCLLRCFLCLSEAETVDHLLLHCVKTQALWNLLFSLFGWLGFSLVQLRKLSLDGMERLWGKPEKRRGKWPPYVYFGQYGRKEICWLLGMRALVRSMGEILFLCGSNKRAVIATLSILVHDAEGLTV
ncbi:hypothetical protein CK203_080976 [Vitis vinifera]|uniref:Reverse transcriptase domain-containing protein n=1 Tax=Vitis vinifera TaxID=29760 RepID=A0A438EMY6_VITVI|nr:hypothetical protein CK203_080976 [Vitis vinifera]